MMHLKMTDSTKAALDDMRRTETPSHLFGSDPAACDHWLREQTEELLAAAGVNSGHMDAYREFVKHVGKLYRSKTGYDLAFNTELSLRRWRDWGLDSGMLQTLVCHIHQALLGYSRGSQ